METKINTYQERLFKLADRLRDVRVIGLIMFAIIVLLISWSGVKVIGTNYTLQKQIAELEQQNSVHNLGNTNLKLSNDYYQTNQYLEIMARQNFGMAAPGETVLSISKATALAHTTEMPDAEAQQKEAIEAKRPAYQRNFQAWMNFLFHRQDQQ
jgi:cell division protein FtsB